MLANNNQEFIDLLMSGIEDEIKHEENTNTDSISEDIEWESYEMK